MATYFTHYPVLQTYSFPLIVTELAPMAPIVSTVQVPHLYTSPVQPLQTTILTPQAIAPICPYTGTLFTTEPILATVAQNTILTEDIPTICCNLYSPAYKTEADYMQEPTSSLTEVVHDQDEYVEESALPEQIAEAIIDEPKKEHPVEFYLTLPKELFPTARMFSMDPNSIIDEFCKISTINDNVPWILDLEFGIPRVPVTRAIAVYDVKFNSIHCKNTPSAIHPGFEKCDSEFKRVILFYYDCIVSSWYKGYMILNYDKSVENFQTWLLKPMRIFGMCWP